jgi:hypothetical protein
MLNLYSEKSGRVVVRSGGPFAADLVARITGVLLRIDARDAVRFPSATSEPT